MSDVGYQYIINALEMLTDVKKERCILCGKKTKRYHRVGTGGWMVWCKKCYKKHSWRIMEDES